MGTMIRILAAAAVAALVAGCNGAATGAPDATATDGASAFTWPASLTVVGDGFPTAGASCRRIGESAATIDMLDDSAALVGCPSREDADKLGGRFLGTVDGVFLVSVPSNPAAAPADGDALVAGTGYNATAQISCSGYKGAAAGMCDAGVIRSGETGGITVEVKLADGTQRVIFFNPDGSFLSFSTAEADGTAAMAISSQKKGDITTAKIGTETYEIPDAFVMGG
ncbi:hypothetical protein [Erythrobacter sp. WG]|uniref:hypothetical protein n=1 Tax=Erythrobacter sp. WG TaxID=2985510 RepID=UPI00226E5150|nr:hypothetical protein [Erythrobacter sp. WG]MCX9147453.1 hypothetical protein [Erythrobacter sp. WG]